MVPCLQPPRPSAHTSRSLDSYQPRRLSAGFRREWTQPAQASSRRSSLYHLGAQGPMKVIDAGQRPLSARWGRCSLARLLHFRAAHGLFVSKPSSGAIVVRRTTADLPKLSVSVRRRVWASGGIVTQLVTHARLGERMVIACLQSTPKSSSDRESLCPTTPSGTQRARPPLDANYWQAGHSVKRSSWAADRLQACMIELGSGGIR